MQTQHKKEESDSVLGIIAGGGNLPNLLVSSCLESGRQFFVISIAPKSEITSIENMPYIEIGIGSVGKAIKELKKNNVEQIVFAGGIKRPDFSELKLDWAGVKLMAKISASRLSGDDSLLSIVIKFFEDEGFQVIGADDILKNILMPEGVLGEAIPEEKHLNDIEFGKEIAKKIGDLDIGQSVVVNNGLVVGVEAVEGTDALIKRCKDLPEANGAVLVKMKKPNQDKRIDLPTIGPDTIENCYKSGIVGIAIEAGAALVIHKNELIKKQINTVYL